MSLGDGGMGWRAYFLGVKRSCVGKGCVLHDVGPFLTYLPTYFLLLLLLQLFALWLRRYPGYMVIYFWEGGGFLVSSFGREMRGVTVGLYWCGDTTTVYNLCCLWIMMMDLSTRDGCNTR